MNYINNYSNDIAKLQNLLKEADAIIIGAGAGLSASAGLVYSGKRFTDNFADFIGKYGYSDMYSAAFQRYSSESEKWAYFSRHIMLNRFTNLGHTVYDDLFSLVKDKNYFVITTNVDHLFQRTGFDKRRLFYTQGDYGLWQCSLPCHDETYDNEDVVREMYIKQQNMLVPEELIPKCPKCGANMSMNLRADHTFVEDSGWHQACDRYNAFVESNKNKNLLLIELGVGFNTPGIIKYNFWKMTHNYPNTNYAIINEQIKRIPEEIIDKSLLFQEDISKVVKDLV